MKLPVGDRDRRALYLGGALLAPMLLWSLAVSPFVSAVRAAHDELAAEQTRLERELAMLALVDAYPAAFRESIDALGQVQPRLLSGGGAGATSAVLTSYVQARARQSEVLISRFEPVPAPEVGPLESVAVKISGESDLQGLMRLLRSLEGGTLLIHVEQLRVVRAGGAARPSGGAAAPQYARPVAAPVAMGPEVVAFECTVRGFARGTVTPRDSLKGGK